MRILVSPVAWSIAPRNDERRMREELHRLKMKLEMMKTQEAKEQPPRRLVEEYQSAFGEGNEVAARCGETSYDNPVSNLKREGTQKEV
jgi:hypothetical protein